MEAALAESDQRVAAEGTNKGTHEQRRRRLAEKTQREEEERKKREEAERSARASEIESLM
jgi:hypothetical protein